jgi:hypothetical protein
MAREAILRGKAWQSVSWEVLPEATEEAAVTGGGIALPQIGQRSGTPEGTAVSMPLLGRGTRRMGTRLTK